MKELRQLICPVCGRAILNHYYQHRDKQLKVCDIEGRAKVKKYKTYKDPDSVVAYYDYISHIYDMHRDYIAVEGEGGRGGLSLMSKIRKEEWEDGFELIKYAVARAIKWWENMGWTSCSEICDIVDNFDTLEVPVQAPEYSGNLGYSKPAEILPPIIKKPGKKTFKKEESQRLRVLRSIERLKKQREQQQQRIWKERQALVNAEAKLKLLQKEEKRANEVLKKIYENIAYIERKHLPYTGIEKPEELLLPKRKLAKKIKEASLNKEVMKFMPPNILKYLFLPQDELDNALIGLQKTMPEKELNTIKKLNKFIRKGGTKALRYLYKKGYYDKNTLNHLLETLKAEQESKLHKSLVRQTEDEIKEAYKQGLINKKTMEIILRNRKIREEAIKKAKAKEQEINKKTGQEVTEITYEGGKETTTTEKTREQQIEELLKENPDEEFIIDDEEE